MSIQQPSDEMKKEDIASFRLNTEDFATIEKYLVPSFHQNGNIKSDLSPKIF